MITKARPTSGKKSLFEEPGWSEIRVGGVTAATHLGREGDYLAPFCIDAVMRLFGVPRDGGRVRGLVVLR